MDAATLQMEKNWQRYHEEQKETALTGSHLANYSKYLGIPEHKFRKGLRVLEIGVGRGHATHEMARRGCVVSALDICERALQTVLDCTERGYLHRLAGALPSDSFDLAISHLVTQHMSEADIIWQFPHVFRSLTEHGRFVIQWAGSHVPGENNLPESIVGEEGTPHVQNTPSMMGGRMVRDPDYAALLVKACGGVMLDTRCRNEWPEYQSYWYVTEARRA
jgi:SAM-dependent methyltransferase